MYKYLYSFTTFIKLKGIIDLSVHEFIAQCCQRLLHLANFLLLEEIVFMQNTNE